MPKLNTREDHSWVRPDKSPERLPKGNRWNGNQQWKVEGKLCKRKEQKQISKETKGSSKGKWGGGEEWGKRICWHQRAKAVPIWHFERLLA